MLGHDNAPVSFWHRTSEIDERCGELSWLIGRSFTRIRRKLLLQLKRLRVTKGGGCQQTAVVSFSVASDDCILPCLKNGRDKIAFLVTLREKAFHERDRRPRRHVSVCVPHPLLSLLKLIIAFCHVHGLSCQVQHLPCNHDVAEATARTLSST